MKLQPWVRWAGLRLLPLLPPLLLVVLCLLPRPPPRPAFPPSILCSFGGGRLGNQMSALATLHG